MMSTHEGEEEIALAVHKRLAQKWPELLTIIVPRHATRGKAVASLAEKAECAYACRSKAMEISAHTAIYIADTMGELGLFYRLCPVVVVGASFTSLGGHNPIEPAQLGAAIILGPSMYDFSEITHEFTDRGAAVQVQNEDELTATVERLLASGEERVRLAHNAKNPNRRKTLYAR